MDGSTIVLIIAGILGVWSAWRMFTFKIRKEKG